MSAPFTPAPWPITKGAYGALHVGPARLDHPGKARIEYAADRGHDLLAQREADARLIHAAPDMLAALETMLARYEQDESPYGWPGGVSRQRVAAIVASAKGGAA